VSRFEAEAGKHSGFAGSYILLEEVVEASAVGTGGCPGRMARVLCVSLSVYAGSFVLRHSAEGEEKGDGVEYYGLKVHVDISIVTTFVP